MHVSHLSAGRKVCQPKLHCSGTIVKIWCRTVSGKSFMDFYSFVSLSILYHMPAESKKSNQLFSMKSNRTLFANSRSIPWVWLEKISFQISQVKPHLPLISTVNEKYASWQTGCWNVQGGMGKSFQTYSSNAPFVLNCAVRCFLFWDTNMDPIHPH